MIRTGHLQLLFAFLGSILFSFGSAAQEYQISLDLRSVKNDMVKVVVKTPQVKQDSIEFRFPKIVPGTYAIYDFGRFILDFKAFDKDRNELIVQSIDPNRRMISNATELRSIEYWVEDTYDTELDNVIFEPAGTNIADKDNFVINTFGFFGYLQNFKNIPYDINIAHANEHFGATSLKKVVVSDSLDNYRSESYVALADEPIMYCAPDTSTLQIGKTSVLISVYSPKGKMTASFIKKNVSEVLNATKNYLGGSLPADRYAFIFYFTNGATLSKAFGALEHSYSSLYVLPEISPFRLAQTIKDVAAHEFFHIVTPLNLHSEEIGDFDFISPSMSKHLWLYEGVTEYFAGHVQATNTLIDSVAYLELLKKKIDNSTKYNDTLPFTEMSQTCLGANEDQYLNVYEKGALIGLHMDVLLREESNGQYGIVDLMSDLIAKYGKDKSFKDEALFDVIEELTYPTVRAFLDKYVDGKTPLPHQDLFESLGIVYSSPKTHMGLTMGNISFSAIDNNTKVAIRSIADMNDFGKDMGYQKGDILFKFNGNKMDLANIETVVEGFKKNKKKGDLIKAVVIRTNSGGKAKKVKLKARAKEVPLKSTAELLFNAQATDEQIKLRNHWLRK